MSPAEMELAIAERLLEEARGALAAARSNYARARQLWRDFFEAGADDAAGRPVIHWEPCTLVVDAPGRRVYAWQNHRYREVQIRPAPEFTRRQRMIAEMMTSRWEVGES